MADEAPAPVMESAPPPAAVVDAAAPALPPSDAAAPDSAPAIPDATPDDMVALLNHPDFQAAPYDKRIAAVNQLGEGIHQYLQKQPDTDAQTADQFAQLMGAAYAKAAPPAPDGVLGSIMAPIVEREPAAAAGTAAGWGAAALASETGPGAVLADVAASTAASAATQYGINKVRGPIATQKAQEKLAVNRREHPLASMVGESVPFITSMLNPVNWFRKGATTTAGKIGQRLAQSSIGGVKAGGISAAQRYANGSASLIDIPKEMIHSGLTMAPLGFLGPAKNLLTALAVKAPSEAAIAATSEAIYNRVAHGQPLDLSQITKGAVSDVPGFILLNALGSLVHGKLKLPAGTRNTEHEPTSSASANVVPTSPESAPHAAPAPGAGSTPATGASLPENGGTPSREAWAGTPPPASEHAPAPAFQASDTRAHEATDARAVAAGFEIPERGTRWTVAGATAEAAQRMADPAYAARMVDFYTANPDVRLDPVNSIVLNEHMARQGEAFEQQRATLARMKPGDPQRPEAVTRLNDLETAYKATLALSTKANSAWGSEGRAIQIQRAQSDLESFPSLLFTTEAKQGAALEPAQRQQLEKDFDAKSKAEQEAATATHAAGSNTVRDEIAPVTEALKQSAPARRQTAAEKRAAILNELARQLHRPAVEAPGKPVVKKPPAPTTRKVRTNVLQPKSRQRTANERSAEKAADAAVKDLEQDFRQADLSDQGQMETDERDRRLTDDQHEEALAQQAEQSRRHWQQMYQESLNQAEAQNPSPDAHLYMMGPVSLMADSIRLMARQARDVYHFGKLLTQKFGAWIRPHINALWQAVKDRVGDAVMKHLTRIGGMRLAMENGNGTHPTRSTAQDALYSYAHQALKNGSASYQRWKYHMEENGFANTDPQTYAQAKAAYDAKFKELSRSEETPDHIVAEAAGHPLDELHGTAARLAKAHASADASLTGSDPAHAATLIARVQSDLARLGHDLSPSETARAITGYGEQPEPKLTPAQKRLRELKSQILADEKLADAKEGKLPWIRRLFSKMSDPVRQKIAQLRDEVRKIENEEVSARRMKTAQHQREAQLENQIRDIEKQIATPGHTGRAPLPPLPETPRSKALKARRDALRAHLDDLRAQEVKSEQNRQRVAVLRGRLNDLLGRLGSGERAQRPSPVEDSPEVRALKGMIASVQAEIRDQDRTMERSPTEEELYNKRRISAAQASAAHFKEKLARNQFKPQLPKAHPLNEEALAAVAEAKAAKAAFDMAAEESGERAQARLERTLVAMQRRIYELQKFLSTGVKPDRGGTPRPLLKDGAEYKALNKELIRLRKIRDDRRVQTARDSRAAAAALKRALDEQIATLDRITAHARRGGKPLAHQEDELRRLQEQRREIDAPELERFKKLQDARTARATQKEAEAQRTGHLPEKKTRRQIVLDAEAREKEVKAELARQKLQHTLNEIELAHQPWYQKLMRYPARVKRGLVLISAPIYLKLALAGNAARPYMTFMEETLGRGFLKLLMPDVVRDAPGEGGASGMQFASDYAKGWARGWTEIKHVMFTGQTRNQILYGAKGAKLTKPQWEAYLTSHPHAAIKAPAWEAAFSASEGNRLAHAGYASADAVPPEKLTALRKAAALDADHAIYKQENVINRLYNRGLGAIGREGTAGQMVAELFRFENTIVKIPTNLVGEATKYLFGSLIAPIQRAIYKGRQSGQLTPEQADSIARTFKKGAVGPAIIATVYFAPSAIRIGGGYVQGERRKHDDLKPGEVEIFGEKLPHVATHAGVFTALQAVGTAIRDAEKGGSLPHAVVQGVLSLVDDIPMVHGTGELMSGLGTGQQKEDARSSGYKSIIPAPVRILAEQQDYTGEHSLLYRLTIDADRPNVTNRGSTFQSGIPDLSLPWLPSRQDLPVKRSR